MRESGKENPTLSERKTASVIEVDGIKRCSAVISGRACNAAVKPPGKFCEKCGAKLVYSDGRRETQFLASAAGRVEMKPPASTGSEVDPDPAVRLDADAVKAALKKPPKVWEDEDETMAFDVDEDGKIHRKGK
ncbi:MAG: hypothetical protein HY569_01925 [Candidatus Magasanikbacteria bacterium]|nr:hypothetical protein [Candidatus Magasanikbacteria bacterium]